MIKTTVFVPGKVHLSGEHAVVYGYPALLAPLNLGVSVIIQPADRRAIHNRRRDGVGLIEKALEVAQVTESVNVRISSTLPVGSGLGSSAALAAAIIKAASRAQGKEISSQEWFEKTMECERIAHGNPSGGDPATVIAHSLIRFVKGKPPVKCGIRHPLQLYLVHTGKPAERTAEMVTRVAARLKVKPAETETLFRQIGTVTEGLQVALGGGKPVRELLQENGELLERLGVVGTRAREFSRAARKLGAAVKISGAGGVRSGSGVVVVFGGDEEALLELYRRMRLRYWKVTIGTSLAEAATISRLEH